jgi:hypothetical protein
MGGAGQDAWEGSAVCALAWVGSRGGGGGGVKGGAGAVELDLLGVKCERRERWWWVGGRTRSGEGVVAGRSNLRQGAVRKRREQPAATGGRTARVAESQIRRFSDVQIFSIFRPHRPQTARCNNLPPRCCTPGQWGADSASGNGRESFPPASKQASRQASRREGTWDLCSCATLLHPPFSRDLCWTPGLLGVALSVAIMCVDYKCSEDGRVVNGKTVQYCTVPSNRRAHRVGP